MVEIALSESREILVASGDEEIQVPVVVIVCPGATEGPSVHVDRVVDNAPP